MNGDYIEFDLVKELGECANMKLPDPTLLDYYKRLNRREILINQDIDDNIVEWTQDIIDWNREDVGIKAEDRVPIKIFINSNGGSLNAVDELISIIKMSKTPVKTIGMGKCYSAGGLLLMSGHKGYRYILDSTEALVHSGSTGAYGNTDKVLDNLEYTKKVEEKTKNYILSHTSISEEEYDKNYRRDWWMDSDEIIQNSLADKVVKNIEELF